MGVQQSWVSAPFLMWCVLRNGDFSIFPLGELMKGLSSLADEAQLCQVLLLHILTSVLGVPDQAGGPTG